MKKNLLKNNTGFTLMEMLLVIGLIAIVASMALFMDLNSYRGDAFRSEIDAIGTSLQTARADALNNIDEKKHGVAFYPDGYKGYVIFEGDSYATRDTTKDVLINGSYDVTFAVTSPTEIVFDQLSADTGFDGNINVVDPSRNMTGTISINNEGKIAW